MTNLGSDNCIAPVGADRFVQSRFCGRSIILALKWTNAKIVLQFAKMFPPRFVANAARDCGERISCFFMVGPRCANGRLRNNSTRRHISMACALLNSVAKCS